MRTSVALAATISLCACDGSGSVSSQEPADFASACELATNAEALDGRLVRFRSGWDVGVEFVRVLDSQCPQIQLFLHAADSNVDLTLCSEPNFRFGCPVNPDFEAKATFTGVFHVVKRVAYIDLISMAEVSSERSLK